jgi:hypothetical protein
MDNYWKYINTTIFSNVTLAYYYIGFSYIEE